MSGEEMGWDKMGWNGMEWDGGAMMLWTVWKEYNMELVLLV